MARVREELGVLLKGLKKALPHSSFPFWLYFQSSLLLASWHKNDCYAFKNERVSSSIQRVCIGVNTACRFLRLFQILDKKHILNLHNSKHSKNSEMSLTIRNKPELFSAYKRQQLCLKFAICQIRQLLKSPVLLNSQVAKFTSI